MMQLNRLINKTESNPCYQYTDLDLNLMNEIGQESKLKLKECKYCHRMFDPDVLIKHAKICKDVLNKPKSIKEIFNKQDTFKKYNQDQSISKSIDIEDYHRFKI